MCVYACQYVRFSLCTFCSFQSACRTSLAGPSAERYLYRGPASLPSVRLHTQRPPFYKILIQPPLYNSHSLFCSTGRFHASTLTYFFQEFAKSPVKEDVGVGSGHGRGEEGDASVSFLPECLSRPHLLCNIFCHRLTSSWLRTALERRSFNGKV